jgi:hypothetical protein
VGPECAFHRKAGAARRTEDPPIRIRLPGIAYIDILPEVMAGNNSQVYSTPYLGILLVLQGLLQLGNIW